MKEKREMVPIRRETLEAAMHTARLTLENLLEQDRENLNLTEDQVQEQLDAFDLLIKTGEAFFHSGVERLVEQSFDVIVESPGKNERINLMDELGFGIMQRGDEWGCRLSRLKETYA
jgi:hypothetical protein